MPASNGTVMQRTVMNSQTASTDEAGGDSIGDRQSRTRKEIQGPSQIAVPAHPSATNTSQNGVGLSLPVATVAAESVPQSDLRPQVFEQGSVPLTETRAVDERTVGSSQLTGKSPMSLSRDARQVSPLIPSESISRRQGMVFDDEFEDIPATATTSSLRQAQQGNLPLSHQRNPSGGATRPRTKTLDAAILAQQTFTVAAEQRHRVGSIGSSASQPLLDERASTFPAAETISHSATTIGRLSELPASLTTPSSKPSKDKKGGKRLLKKQISRPSSPLPIPGPSVDCLPLPLYTPEPTKLIMLMMTLGGRMRGNIEYRMRDVEPTWHRGVAYIDDEKACLMFNSGHDGPFFKTLMPDLRGCAIFPTEHGESDGSYLKIIAAGTSADLLLRPAADDQWNLWLAALLCWQQTRPPATRALNNGGGKGSSSAPDHPRPEFTRSSPSTDKVKAPTIIKVGTTMLWDKGPTGSANDLMQRCSTRDSVSPVAGWRQISSILHDNGELKLLVENASSPLCVIQLSQLSRCAIQQLDHTVLDEEFCLAIFPFYASRASHLSIFRPIYLALHSRVQFEVWFVLLRAFAVPELFKLSLHDQGTIHEVLSFDDEGDRNHHETFRIEKTIGVRVTEAKVRALPTGSDETYVQQQHHHQQQQQQQHQQHGPHQHQQLLNDKHNRSRVEQDPLVGTYVAEVILDGEVRARTATKVGTKNPFWREDCEFSDLPHTVQEVSIVLKRADAIHDATLSAPEVTRIPGQHEHLYGTVHIALDKLQRGKDHEDWLQIMDAKQQPIGTMLIKISHAEQIALLSKEYEPLAEILHRFPSGLTTMISASLPGQLRRLSEIFLNIFQSTGNAGDWLMALVEDEIDGIGSQASIKKFRFSSRLKSNESIESSSDRELMVRDMSKSLAGEANLLFRGNSLLTQSLEFHMRRLGFDFLEAVLQNKINEINAMDPDCEVDTSKLSHTGNTDLDQRWSRLMRYTTDVWRCIARSADSLPDELRHILKYIRAVAEDRYGDFLRTVAYTAVSGFLFLRFICPAILSPKLFGLLRDHPRPRAQRTLTLIAKVLQKMSNMSTFGKREEWMEPMNRFLTSQRPVFRDYIDQVCGIPAERGDVKTVPAAYSTPVAILGRLGLMAKEGFPSLPYLIDQGRSLAGLVRLWVDAAPEEVKKGNADGELLIFNEICLGLQKRADACLTQVECIRAAKATSVRGVADQLAESLEQATLIESLSVPYPLPPVMHDGDAPPGSSESDGPVEDGPSRRRATDFEHRKAGALRQASAAAARSKNGKVGRTILHGIMRMGGRAESPDAKSHR